MDIQKAVEDTDSLQNSRDSSDSQKLPSKSFEHLENYDKLKNTILSHTNHEFLHLKPNVRK